MLIPLLCHVEPLNDGNCRFTMPVVKNRCNRDVLPHTFNIGVFKSIKKDPDTLQHIYNESANIIEGCNVAFDTNACWNFS